MGRLIIYGDIHGCYEEFVKLRRKIEPSQLDIEVCVGDVITRGKKSIKTLRYLQENNIKSVVGNHEDKIIRYIKHGDSVIKNPINLDKDESDIVSNLSIDDIDFLNNMPLFIRFGNVTVLHAGLQNHFNLDKLSKKERSKILRLRYVTKENKFIPFGEDDENSIFWSEVYDGNQGFIVYGHQKFENVKKDNYSLGIDTGCVFGNKLTAVVFEDVQNSNNYKIYDTPKKS